VDRPGTYLNPQANVHSDPIVRSSKSSLSGEVVAEEANTRVKEVSSAPNKDVNVRGIETTAANSESEQGDQLHQRAVRYNTTTTTIIFTALFPGPPRRAGARRELLDFMMQGKINRGRHTIRTNQYPHPPSPHIFYGPDALPAAEPTVSKHWRQPVHSD